MNEEIKEYLAEGYSNSEPGTHREHSVLIAYYYFTDRNYPPKQVVDLLRQRALLENAAYAFKLNELADDIEEIAGFYA